MVDVGRYMYLQEIGQFEFGSINSRFYYFKRNILL